MSALSINSTIELNNRQQMPMLGLGVSGMEVGQHTEQAIHWALDAGYRHIDTAKLYKNEASVGRAVKSSPIRREDIWITTKLWPTDFLHPRKALESSLKRLDLDYVDLYLIHWPTPLPIPGFDQKLWRGMEKLVDAGLCKTIGVSNFTVPRLAKIISSAHIPPAVNQIRCSPFNYPKELHTFCIENNIAFEAYSPLTQGAKLNNPILKKLATDYKKLTAQIMLRWALQKGIIVIPKSSNKSRIEQNTRIYNFELAKEDVAKLDLLVQ